MRLRLTTLALSGSLMALPALGEELTVELSTPLVSIETDFAGSDIALFGVVERDAQTISRSGPYEIIAVVTGPLHDVLIQRKERRFGLWLAAEGHRFTDVPSYYALYGTPGTAELLAPGGVANSLSIDEIGKLTAEREPFRKALVAERIDAGLFDQAVGAVDMLTRTFFRAIIRLPGQIEEGPYVVTTHLFADETRLDTNTQTFVVRKEGFEERLFALSRSQPLLYGLGVVVLALVTGYVGGVVFRRN